MSVLKTMLTFLLLVNLGCASERLYVRVIDDEGRPVPSATVNVDFTSSHVMLGEGSSHHYEAKTDTNGNAVVKFNCTTSDFAWHVEADGYYRGNIHCENFNGEDVIIPPGVGFVKLHEHEKRGEAVLYRKKNPQSMYAYTREMDIKSPRANGRYGFDLQCFDWLPPHGKGKVVEAFYGKIYGDIAMGWSYQGVSSVSFLYYFNPTPNDRNLEWDRKNNLCDKPGKLEISINHTPMLLP